MTISTITPSTPADSDAASGGAQQIRDLKADVQNSFPGFTTGEDVITRPASEINDAAQNFSTTQTKADDADTLSKANADKIQLNADKLVDVTTAIHSGTVDGTGTLTRTPATGTWNCVRNSAGRYTVTHDQGTLAVVATVETDQTGQRWSVMIDNVGVGTFDIDVRSGNGYDDAVVNFIAL